MTKVTISRVNRLLLTVICFTLSFGTNADGSEQQPNIVLIISDYMGYHDTEPYGAELVRMRDLFAAGSSLIPLPAEIDRRNHHAGQHR
jgi:hypothetical protein